MAKKKKAKGPGVTGKDVIVGILTAFTSGLAIFLIALGVGAFVDGQQRTAEQPSPTQTVRGTLPSSAPAATPPTAAQTQVPAQTQSPAAPSNAPTQNPGPVISISPTAPPAQQTQRPASMSNIIKAKPRNIEKVYQTIESPERVRKSRQLPFRFLSAYKAVVGIGGSRVFDALESAVDASIDNMEKLPGTTVIAVDTSGSMGGSVSAKSDVKCVEIGMMLGMIANRICENSIFYTFDTSIQKHAVSKRSGILYAVTHNARAGGGTYMQLPFQQMINDGIKADRVIIISDNECNGGWGRVPVQSIADEYRRVFGNDIWVHAIDLQEYGTQQFYGAKTNVIAGWSEKALQFIPLAEAGAGTLQSVIKNYEW